MTLFHLINGRPDNFRFISLKEEEIDKARDITDPKLNRKVRCVVNNAPLDLAQIFYTTHYTKLKHNIHICATAQAYVGLTPHDDETWEAHLNAQHLYGLDKGESAFSTEPHALFKNRYNAYMAIPPDIYNNHLDAEDDDEVVFQSINGIRKFIEMHGGCTFKSKCKTSKFLIAGFDTAHFNDNLSTQNAEYCYDSIFKTAEDLIAVLDVHKYNM